MKRKKVANESHKQCRNRFFLRFKRDLDDRSFCNLEYLMKN